MDEKKYPVSVITVVCNQDAGISAESSGNSHVPEKYYKEYGMDEKYHSPQNKDSSSTKHSLLNIDITLHDYSHISRRNIRRHSEDKDDLPQKKRKCSSVGVTEDLYQFPDAYRHNSQNIGDGREKNTYAYNFDKDRPMSFKTTKYLTTKLPSEILLTINKPHCGFMALIKQETFGSEMMAYLLILLGKACTSGLNQNVSSLLNAMCSNKNFLLLCIQKYLVSLRMDFFEDFHLDSLTYLITFLQKFQQTLPSSSAEIISMLLPLLRSTCENFLKTHDVYHGAMEKIDEIDEENKQFLDRHTASAIKKASYREAMQFCEPPENFRAVPVLPNADDIHCKAFLRPNIVEGKYWDTEHYLDIQYRLLREDYVKPLRDGIADYLMQKKAGKSVKNYHNHDVRVYENVCIVKHDFVNGSIVHIAQFSSKKKFAHIKWEYSKRFLSGSLLCLSSDNFQTMLFASVAQRLPEKLKEGLLLIRFEDVSDETLNLDPLKQFVVIETSAYFEAYRHNLKALQELSERTLPFKKYIINVENTVQSPQYLHTSTNYDMRPLLIPFEDMYIKHKNDIFGEMSIEYKYPDNVSCEFQSVQILNDSCWPSASSLNLDDSQYLALKAAVTKEFALIQGPPGTGKTYVGLRIAQLLLHNIDKWFLRETNSLPILVVCFTNHALDQFLEGLMRFTDKIVRIGGRGKNGIVSTYQLSTLKHHAIVNKEIPRYISSSMWHKNHELKRLKRFIEKINRTIQISSEVVFGEDDFEDAIPQIHYDSLKSMLMHPCMSEYNLYDDGSVIQDWLGTRSRPEWSSCQSRTEQPGNFSTANQPGNFSTANQPGNFSTTNQPGNFSTTNQLGNFSMINQPGNHLKTEQNKYDSFEKNNDVIFINEASDSETDIEFIEAERNIDSEEFANVSFDIENLRNEEFLLPESLGWQVHSDKKQQLNYIRNSLQNSQPLEERESMSIKNVWSLDMPKRWRLYKFWLERFITEKKQERLDLQLLLKQQFLEVCETRTEEDIFILNKAHVVGMTTTGAAKYREIVLRLNPQILIVEEAAEILESHIVTSLAPGTQHVIMIGDHQQLQPSPTVHMLAVKYDLNVSLFERMIKNKMDYFQLSIQHRMRPEVAELICPHIYKDLKNHEIVTKFENIKGVGKNVFFVTHNYSELQEYDSKSKSNEYEAKFIIMLCKYFVLQGYNPSQITVLTTYSGQLSVMKKLITDVIKKVRLTIVDSYQGEENDIILISFVRSNEKGEIGFLKVANRVCVALSRAKKGLFCIGNFELLAEKSDLWKNIVNTLKQNQAIGPSLELVCQSHPNVSNFVANEKDFISVPEGGCTSVCGYRLECGHTCSLICHPYDREHENFRCHKACKKTCEFGHKCLKKCYAKCGICVQLMEKTISPCGHKIQAYCYKLISELVCISKCEKVLACGHKCVKLCSESCTDMCKEKVRIRSPVCNHMLTIDCYNQKDSTELLKRCSQLKSCSHPCNAVLDCGHICKGNCDSCHQGRLHVACNQPCKRILVCGHECQAPCVKSCPPCKLPCQNKCNHSQCPKECGVPCIACIEPCEWHCKHQRCFRTCGEICSRVPCNEPCSELLSCGHPCIGFCGERCPSECRYCDSEKVKEIFFGTEDEEDSRFIRLDDCNHILEVNGLKEWMKMESDSDHEIQMKACPKCKTIIRTNLRFGNIVKDCLRKIESVKRVTFGNVSDNKERQKELIKYIEQNSSSLKKLKHGAVYETWNNFLSKRKCRSIQEITAFENILRVSLDLANIVHYLKTSTLHVSQDSSVKDNLDVLSAFMNSSKTWLVNFINYKFVGASEQQLHQLTWETHRLHLGMKLLMLVNEYVLKSPFSDFENCVSVLTKYSPFGDDEVKQFSTSYKALAQACGSTVINVSELEKKSILKAMDLKAGHWYQCPNGHVYCITECGGAMQEGRCNECNEKIGGSNHSLLSTNRVATDMDGARHSAWSDAMNLANYDIQMDANEER